VFIDGTVVLGSSQEAHDADTEVEGGQPVVTRPPGEGLYEEAVDPENLGEQPAQEEQKLLTAGDRSGQWDKAVLLLESGQYDDAIDAFSRLFNTEYDIPARANIQKAAEVASVGMRRKSANIFVKARREMEYDLKKELLRESWQLLHDITVKYPEVKLIDKVRKNLLIIEKHIDGFDPLMLQELMPVVGSAQEDLPEEYLY
jgi:tetratricopeptide (TPR) repeat protein